MVTGSNRGLDSDGPSNHGDRGTTAQQCRRLHGLSYVTLALFRFRDVLVPNQARKEVEGFGLPEGTLKNGYGSDLDPPPLEKVGECITLSNTVVDLHVARPGPGV